MKHIKAALITLLFVILGAVFIDTARGEEPKPFDYNQAILRIQDRQRAWWSHERAQQRLHEEAEHERLQLCKHGHIEFCITDPKRQAVVFVTHYHAVEEETDASPCIGAGLTNVCDIANHENVIALSQDLVGRASWKKFTYGDYVVMEHSSKDCSGVFRVEDTMNPRYTNRADILNTKDYLPGNCAKATIRKVIHKNII